MSILRSFHIQLSFSGKKFRSRDI